MAVLANMARMTTATTGTGTITLGDAADGFLSFADAGITDGQTVSYAIEDGVDREVGTGVYTANGTTLTRTVVNSTNSGAAISLSGEAEVFITALAADFMTDAERSKLVGVEAGATANSSDATLLNRANHTGTQLAATISDFSTAADARVSAAIGSTVQAYNAKLGTLAGQTWANDRFTYYTGASTAAIGTITSFGRSLIDDANAAAARTTLGLEIGTDVQAYDADTVKSDTGANLTAGFTTTAVNDGTKSSGTYTPSPSGGNIRRAVNGGAHTLAAPSATGDYTMIVKYTNNGSAGAITLSGFTVVTGDEFTTTNGHKFLVYIAKVDGDEHANVVALQ